MTTPELYLFVSKLYEKAYNAIDILALIENGGIQMSIEFRYDLLIAFNKVKKEFRNEKLLLLFVINFTFFDKETKLDNISFM